MRKNLDHTPGLNQIITKTSGTQIELSGSYVIKHPKIKDYSFQVLVGEDEGGWEHISVTLLKGEKKKQKTIVKRVERNPTWDEMCFIKWLFFEYEEEVIQIHPKVSEYVNLHDNCLHLWRLKDSEAWNKITNKA